MTVTTSWLDSSIEELSKQKSISSGFLTYDDISLIRDLARRRKLGDKNITSCEVVRVVKALSRLRAKRKLPYALRAA
jgi:hypothetical protein